MNLACPVRNEILSARVRGSVCSVHLACGCVERARVLGYRPYYAYTPHLSLYRGRSDVGSGEGGLIRLNWSAA